MFKSPTKKPVLRGNDPTGYGYYGASRGSRKHEGVDYLTIVDEPIYACIAGIVRIGQVYAHSADMQLVEIKNTEFKIQQMYVKPIVYTGQSVEAGALIGYAQNISAFHGGKMKNHIHITAYKNGLLTDPEPLIKF